MRLALLLGAALVAAPAFAQTPPASIGQPFIPAPWWMKDPVIAAMMAGLRSAIESYVLAGAATVDDWDRMADRLRSEHRALVAAIDAGEIDTARRLVRAHITGYYTAAGLTRAITPQN